MNKNNKKNINRVQNQQIAALNKKVAQLKMLSGMKKKTKKRVQKTTRLNQSRHPLHDSVRAILRPQEAIPGAASHLVNAAPSQKYTLRSRWSTGINASNECVAFICPAFQEDPYLPSAVVYSGSTATSPIIESGTAGTGLGTGVSTYKPVRPYGLTTGLSWRLVSYNLRVRYTGTALNANGTLKCLNTPHGEMDIVTQSTVLTYDAIRQQMEGNLLTSLRTVHDRAVYDYPGIGGTEWFGGDNYFCSDITADEGSVQAVGVGLGQLSSQYTFGEPGMIFSYFNFSTAAVQLEFELIENWEVKGPSISPFLTPSHADPALHEEVMRTVFASHIHASKSGTTSASAAEFLKRANKESKSPLGRAVIAAALA